MVQNKNVQVAVHTGVADVGGAEGFGRPQMPRPVPDCAFGIPLVRIEPPPSDADSVRRHHVEPMEPRIARGTAQHKRRAGLLIDGEFRHGAARPFPELEPGECANG